MIAKRVPRKAGEKSSYRELANYILDRQGGGSKVRSAWSTNCAAPDDFDLCIAEVVATQDLNTRSKIDKTYHLVVSLAPGEDLTDEQWKETERRMCEAIGLGQHQRICAVHSDTDHIHLHIAISKIHPLQLTCIEPFYDKLKLQTVCRDLEKEFGLKPGLGPEARIKLAPAEAHQGLETFAGWIRSNLAPELSKILSEPGVNWQQVQALSGRFGLEIRERGAGLVFSHLERKLFVKASEIDRSFSKGKLEKALGPFETSAFTGIPEKIYVRAPLGASTSAAALYAEYKNQRGREWDEYQRQTGGIGADRSKQLAEIKARYAKRRLEIKLDTLIAKGRKREIYRKVSEQMKKELEQLYAKSARSRGVAKDELKTGAWRDWLMDRAIRGDEEALGALRIKRQTEKDPIGSFSGVGGKPVFFHGLTRQVQKDGRVEYKTAEGGIIVDTGSEILVKTLEQDTVRAAMNMAASLYGETMKASGNDEFMAVVKAIPPEKAKEQANDKGKKLDHDSARS